MMPSGSTIERPSYSYVVATSRSAFREYRSEALSSPSSGESEIQDDPTNNQPDVSHLGSERFQVDRRKLEQMIKTPSDIEGVNSAQKYFQKIMDTTDTVITWPRNLKLGARSGKNPYVRIVGTPDDNNWAKGLILSHLATKGPLLKMKMIIFNSDHAHIIGRGGFNINRIMEQTETHIHFPDTSRRNMAEKKNQVSLYGSLEGLENARTALRWATPLLISFELPAGTKHDRQYTKKLEVDYSVKVIFYNTTNPTSPRVLIKGYENQVDTVKEAARQLLCSMYGFMAAQTPVIMQMEICQQFYDIATGWNNSFLSTVMQTTNAKITIPTYSEINQHSHIIISGSIDGVHEAKQELMGCLPIELTYDIPDDQSFLADIMSLDSKYGVRIAMQHKQRDGTISVTVAGAENHIRHIYSAYQEILGMQKKSTNDADVPKAYMLAEPAYRRSLESTINSYSIGIDIWAPTEPNSESNFLQITPLTQQTTWNGAYNSSNSAYHLPVYSPENGATTRERRRSSDWVVMKGSEEPSDDDDQQVEVDFDPEDLETAYILMSMRQS